MPTASTSQILGFNECFEPYTSNIYMRRVLAGEFQVVNPWLLRELVELGLWNDSMKQKIIAHGGSIQNIAGIPDHIKALYKTVWEISQKVILDMAADRGAFVCQSQSLNIHLSAPTFGQLTSMHFYGWKKGLKTGSYYLRTRPAAQAIQFTVDTAEVKAAKEVKKASAAQIASERSGRANEGARSALAASTTGNAAVPNTNAPVANGTASDAAALTSQAVPAGAGGRYESMVQGVGRLGVDGTVTEDGPGKPRPGEDGSADPAEDEGFKAAQERARRRQEEADARLACSLENKDACLMCSG